MPLSISNLWSLRTSAEEEPKAVRKQQLLYELSKTVFEYMDPSSRFHFSLHLPSLRSIERGTHLKINELILRSNHIFIDKTKYQFNIDLKYNKEKPPLRVNETVDHDVDEFGFRTNTNDIMMNGDVLMEDDSDNVESGPMEAIKKKEPPECNSTLKLTITPENGEPRIYTSSKIITIYEGMKMLIGAIFGSRTVVCNVESMFISTGNLRWIVPGEKPLVRNILLQGYYSVNLDGLRSICHPTSFPLKTLGLEMDFCTLDHEILVNAGNLLIQAGFEIHDESDMDELMEVSHPKVQMFRTSPYLFSYFMDLWLARGRKVGTSWSFRVEQSEPYEYIDILRGNARVIESDRRSIKLSMRPSSILSVSYGDRELHDDGFYQQEAWSVKMEVLKR
ncbi:unnamed protein product [Caenorhabditis nigoni]